jgi:small subunit ribosomal protein S1
MPDETPDSFAALFEATPGPPAHARAQRLNVGDRCKGEVVRVGKDAVFVEIVDPPPVAKRLQAFFELPDLTSPGSRDEVGGVQSRGSRDEVGGVQPRVLVKVGDVIDGVVVETNSRAGGIRLSRSMGKPAGLAELETAYAVRMPVEGEVTAVNKGGLEVEIGGARAFCPMSQADRTFVQDPQTFIGRRFAFLVTELGEGGKRVVLSRRAALEQERAASRVQAMEKLTVGAAVPGTVTSVRDIGAFVDLGGVEGLIPRSQLSYDRDVKPSDLVSAGDAVTVQVLEIQTDAVDKRGKPQTKITLSLKALSSDPWDRVAQLVPTGKAIEGTVARIMEFGAFVRLAAGIDGLLHVSELSGKNGTAGLRVGQTLRVVVRSIDAAARKIALAPAPEGLELGDEARAVSIGVGSIVTGKVDRIEPFGIFLQIDGTSGRQGRGLIPNVELGTARGVDTRKLFPLGTQLTAKVLETGDGKIRLSLRAVKDDEERADFEGYRASTAAAGKLGTLADLLKKR